MKAVENTTPQDKFPNRISLATCKQLLFAKGNQYADDEVLQIRDLLYALADIDYNIFLEHKKDVEINGSSST